MATKISADVAHRRSRTPIHRGHRRWNSERWIGGGVISTNGIINTGSSYHEACLADCGYLNFSEGRRSNRSCRKQKIQAVLGGLPCLTWKGPKRQPMKEPEAAVFVAAVTTLFSVLAIFDIRILPGFSPWSLVDGGYSLLWRGVSTRCPEHGPWLAYCFSLGSVLTRSMHAVPRPRLHRRRSDYSY